MLSKPYMVVVRWRDMTGEQGWFKESEIEQMNPSVIETVGWLLCDGEVMRLAASRAENGVYGTIFSIPKGCIESILALIGVKP